MSDPIASDGLVLAVGPAPLFFDSLPGRTDTKVQWMLF